MIEMIEIQAQIIEALGVKSVIDPEQEIRTRIDFLKEYAKKTNTKGFVLGISGGQDSSLAGKLAQLAVIELRAEGYDAQFLALRLPYGVQKDEDDAQLALNFIQPDETFEFNIKETVDAFENTYNTTPGYTLTDYDKGNAKARVRMLTQYAYASDKKMLVVGTDNAPENFQGFYTRHGDQGADILPNYALTKRQETAMLKILGAPERLYTKAPTADLLDNIVGQPDEVELGVTYKDLDDYLEGKPVSAEAEEIMVQRYVKTEFKRHDPITPLDTWWKE